MTETRRRPDIFPYALVSPAIIITLAVVFFPMFRTMMYSLMQYILYKPQEKAFSGLENYIQAFSDPLFYTSLLNTGFWIAGIITFQFLLGFVTALILKNNFRGQGLARSLVLIPWVTPSVITALMWRWMYDGNYGLINQILRRLGI